MPRAARASVGGVCHHVINRGNRRGQVFFKDGDYQPFHKAMAHASIEVPMRILGYCLLPNHFHLVLWPLQDGDLSRWMHWLLNTHIRRHHKHYQSSGHIWQGRFKAFPIAADEHLLTVLRYVERNPVRANLVKQADHWLWSSAGLWTANAGRPEFMKAGPVERPQPWLKWVNQVLTEAELAALRRSVNRGTPCGNQAWSLKTAQRLGLESTLMPRGRPRKNEGGSGASGERRKNK